MHQPMGEEEIIAVAIITVAVFSILSTAIVLFVVVYNRTQRLHKETLKNKILESEIHTYEKTAINISREIHDNIGYDLNITRTLLEGDLSRPDTQSRIKQKVDDAMLKLQNISRSLIAHHLKSFDLIETLHKEFDTLSRNSTVQFKLICNVEILKLSDITQINVFRICQEAISNAIKHGQANRIEVDILVDENSLTISVNDNGKGFDQNEIKKQKNGTLNMMERAEFIQAQLTFSSIEGNGTQVKLLMPYQSDQRL